MVLHKFQSQSQFFSLSGVYLYGEYRLDPHVLFLLLTGAGAYLYGERVKVSRTGIKVAEKMREPTFTGIRFLGLQHKEPLKALKEPLKTPKELLRALKKTTEKIPLNPPLLKGENYSPLCKRGVRGDFFLCDSVAYFMIDLCPSLDSRFTKVL